MVRPNCLCEHQKGWDEGRPNFYMYMYIYMHVHVYVTYFSYRDGERCHHLEVAVRTGGLVVCIVT